MFLIRQSISQTQAAHTLFRVTGLACSIGVFLAINSTRLVAQEEIVYETSDPSIVIEYPDGGEGEVVIDAVAVKPLDLRVGRVRLGLGRRGRLIAGLHASKSVRSPRGAAMGRTVGSWPGHPERGSCPPSAGRSDRRGAASAADSPARPAAPERRCASTSSLRERGGAIRASISTSPSTSTASKSAL